MVYLLSGLVASLLPQGASGLDSGVPVALCYPQLPGRNSQLLCRGDDVSPQLCLLYMSPLDPSAPVQLKLAQGKQSMDPGLTSSCWVRRVSDLTSLSFLFLFGGVGTKITLLMGVTDTNR